MSGSTDHRYSCLNPIANWHVGCTPAPVVVTTFARWMFRVFSPGFECVIVCQCTALIVYWGSNIVLRQIYRFPFLPIPRLQKKRDIPRKGYQDQLQPTKSLNTIYPLLKRRLWISSLLAIKKRGSNTYTKEHICSSFSSNRAQSL